jgi:hypothetical protein
MMLRPILATSNPYEAAEEFVQAGWSLDFSTPPDSGDPLCQVSLCDCKVLLGTTEGYVPEGAEAFVGTGVVFYINVPEDKIRIIYENHLPLQPTAISKQPWGDIAFQVAIHGYKFMIAAEVNERETPQCT